jgi:hypothetical protein
MKLSLQGISTQSGMKIIKLNFNQDLSEQLAKGARESHIITKLPN